MSHPDDEAELRRRLAQQITAVRTQFHDAVAAYSVRVQGVLAQVGDDLAAYGESTDAATREARSQVLRDLIADIEDLELKPDKGRRRDLKAVEKIAKRLSSKLDEL